MQATNRRSDPEHVCETVCGPAPAPDTDEDESNATAMLLLAGPPCFRGAIGLLSTCRSRYTAGALQDAPYHPRSRVGAESTPAQAPEGASLPTSPPQTRPSPFRSGELRRCRQTCSD